MQHSDALLLGVVLILNNKPKSSVLTLLYLAPKTRVFGAKFLNVGFVGFVGDTPMSTWAIAAEVTVWPICLFFCTNY